MRKVLAIDKESWKQVVREETNYVTAFDIVKENEVIKIPLEWIENDEALYESIDDVCLYNVDYLPLIMYEKVSNNLYTLSFLGKVITSNI